MASKKALLGGAQIKVENMSGFDKSRFNAFTAPLGAIVPMAKQLMIPGKFNLRIKISAQLPPLATDSFLRTHLKVEAFAIPLRLCYGGFQSWFSREPISTGGNNASNLTVAQMPRLRIYGTRDVSGTTYAANTTQVNTVFGPHSLMDYFGVKYPLSSGSVVPPSWISPQTLGHYNYSDFNIFPFLAYQLCYHHFYRNKLVERPVFSVPAVDSGYSTVTASSLPYVSYWQIQDFIYNLSSYSSDNRHYLLNGNLFSLRQRNYGFDYFTTALPSAQQGSPMTVDTSSGSFSIGSLRSANQLQHFAEINQLAGPDYVQACRARYGKAPSNGVAQKPILFGSADFPMFTSGVEQSAQGNGSGATSNPFAGMGARYGRGHAEGSDFVCSGEIDEPCYLMVMCSLVPEANYAIGVAHDMRLFTEAGSLVDLPTPALELMGLEPVYSEELGLDDSSVPGSGGGIARHVFGYQPRYMWHKAGQNNEVHGLFRQGASLDSFIPQRLASNGSYLRDLDTAMLKVNPTDLDNVMAVSGSLSQYGVMVDSSIDLFVSEPLGESALPSLADPAYEHGREVYVRRGGVGV